VFSGIGVPVVFPSSSSVIRHSPSLHGVPRVGSPASSVQRERCDFPRPSRLASHSLGSTTQAPVVSLPRRPGACVRGPWPCSPVGRPARCRWRQRDLPGSWTNPCARATLSDPGGTFAPGHSARRCCRHSAPVSTGSLDVGCFRVQSRGSFARCLRFAAWIAPAPRKTRFTAGGQPLPGGPLTHRVRSREVSRWLRHRSSSPRLTLAQGADRPPLGPPGCSLSRCSFLRCPFPFVRCSSIRCSLGSGACLACLGPTWPRASASA
jgi:hypothetical protein